MTFDAAQTAEAHEQAHTQAHEQVPVLTPNAAPPTDFTLQLLHFADAEAGLLASQTAPNLAALVDAFDDDYANTLILAGGDNYLPGPFLNAGTDAVVAAVHTRGNNPGAADIEIHNIIGVEASTIGNHEFDLGTNAFSDVIADTTFPYLSANLDFSADGGISARYLETVGVGGLENVTALARRIVPSAVVTKGGETIGLVGATTQILETISSTGNVEVKGFAGDGAETNDMVLLAAQLQPVIDDLIAQGVDKIILMAHLQQIGFEQALAPLLRGVDIILAAGSNTRLGDANDVPVAFPGHEANFANTYPIVTAGNDGKPTLIVNTDNEFTYLGRLVVDFDANGEIIVDNLAGASSINGAYAATTANVAMAWGVTESQLATTAFADGTKGENVADITQAVQSVISAKDGTIFGYTDVYLEGERNFVRNQETNLGNITADANLDALQDALGVAAATTFTASLKNGGGIRAQIGSVDVISGAKNPPLANPGAGKEEGAISLLDAENALRFNNRLMSVDLSAADLKAVLEHGVAVLGNQGRFPQIGGVTFSYDPDLAAGSRIRDVALIDADGNVVATVVDDGVVVAGAPGVISLVTLNFLANGGDGYPIKTLGENFRFLLDNGTLSAPVDPTLNFTAVGVVPTNSLGELQAFNEYVAERYPTQTTAYDRFETAKPLDLRIQDLNVRPDNVLTAAAGSLTDAADGANGGAGADSIYALGGNDVVYALAGNDVVLAGAGNDSVSGGAGNDVVAGGAGADTIDGGAGFDVASYGTDSAVQIYIDAPGSNQGAAAGDTFANIEGFYLSDGFDIFVGGAAGEVVVDLGGGAILNGKGGSDTLIGGDTASFLQGGDGDDIVVGGNGNDSVQGDAGADFVLGDLGADIIFGGAGNDGLFGDDGADFVDGGDGADVAFGGAGSDTVAGGAGSDFIDGGAGDDLLLTGDGADAALGDAGADTIIGGAGSSVLIGGAGADQISAGAGASFIDGGDDNDLLFGGFANDSIIGGAGNDQIAAGLGSDVILGGTGTDVFNFSGAAAGGQADYVADFMAGETIVLAAANQADTAFFVVGSDIFIGVTLGGSGSYGLVIANSTLADVQAATLFV